MYKCPYCCFTFSDLSELESHLLESHFLTIQSYYEMELCKKHDYEKCYKCGENRSPLTYIDEDAYYLPCWGCLNNKYERAQVILTVQSAIRDYFSRVIKDRYLQMFLVSDHYFNWTLGHTYSEFKEVLKNLQKYSRNKIWFLDWIPGFPKTISLDNLEGIKVKLIDDWYDIDSGKDEIKINSWVVKFPEVIPFDSRHHYRYNIFNSAIDPKLVKRIRLKDEADNCIKFFSSEDNPAHKTIFRIENWDGELIKNLSEQDLVVTKLVLMRNKFFMKLISQIVDELVKNCGIFRDSAFLRNTILTNPKNENSKVNLSWTYDKNNDKDNFINISIL